MKKLKNTLGYKSVPDIETLYSNKKNIGVESQIKFSNSLRLILNKLTEGCYALKTKFIK